MNQARDRQTGRYAHVWAFQGYDRDGIEWAACEHCERWRSSRTLRITARHPGELRPSPQEYLA